ncbi:methyltransferase domain-containing protein [Aminobacter sp. Piv2-1]|uniref:methyltransferase domain-containing protein n=1 Tax=Aminobacter sp. Piv2-1 TaxID=3031122 RepID=UPI0030A2B3D7
MAFENLRRNLAVRLRRVRSAQTATFDKSAIGQFHFYQFKASTADFFFRRLQRTNVQVVDTPHFALASALATGDKAAIATASDYYLDYLKASWATDDKNRIERRLADFRSHFEAYRASNKSRPPILTRLEPNGSLFVVDGNHRTAFALALGRTIKAEIWPIDLAFLKYSHMKEYYGTGNRNLPYQSLFFNRQEIINGRRNDAIRRLQMIPSHVLNGSRILDVASNVGMSSLLARSLGAGSSLGLEISPAMVDVASRFAMFEGLHPTVEFRRFDVDNDTLPATETFDTAFMFSIYSHLRKPENLVRIARENVSRYVVFEAHPGHQKERYSSFFDSGLFRSVTELGVLPQSIFRQKPDRILWLCEK